MIFSERVLFLHVPKAGGSSVVSHVLELLPKPLFQTLPAGHEASLPAGVSRLVGSAHEGLLEARVVLRSRGYELEDLPLIVACVRDPYALEVSRYAFLRQDLNAYNHGNEQAVALHGDFELFARCSGPHGQRPLEAYYLLDGTVPANLRIVRLERVDQELGDALAQIGVEPAAMPVPHHNRSAHADHRRYYTPAAELAVYEKYKWVFDAGFYPRIDVDGPPAPSRWADPAAVERLVESGLAEAQDDFARATTWLAAAEIHRHWLRPAARQAALEHALDHARRVASPRLVGLVVQGLARCLSLVGSGSVAAGIAGSTTLLDGDDGVMGSAATALARAELLAAAGRFEEARSALARVSPQSPEVTLDVASAGASIELLAGDPAGAERLVRHGRPWSPHVTGDRVEALLQLGRHAEAERIVGAQERIAPADDLRAQARWRRARARLRAAAGATDSAVACAEEAVALIGRCDAPSLHADALVDLAAALGAAGRGEEAVAALSEAVARHEGKGNIASARSVAGRLGAAREAAQASA